MESDTGREVVTTTTSDENHIQQPDDSHDTDVDNLCTRNSDSDEDKIDKSKRKSENSSGENDTLQVLIFS